MKLTWSSSVTVRDIRLFDRPNPIDQILRGTLSFSNGADIAVGSLDNYASEPAEVKFDARTITWVKFTVTGVKPGTTNIGVSEFEVSVAPSGPTQVRNPGVSMSQLPTGNANETSTLLDLRGRKIMTGRRAADNSSGIYFETTAKSRLLKPHLMVR